MDDEAGIRALVAAFLKDTGCELEFAAGGNQALRMLGERPCDLLIVDLTMPDMDGIEVIRTVHSTWPAMKVIAMSGFMGGAMLDVAEKLGAFVSLEKPFSQQELLAAVRRLLGRSAGA